MGASSIGPCTILMCTSRQYQLCLLRTGLYGGPHKCTTAASDIFRCQKGASHSQCCGCRQRETLEKQLRAEIQRLQARSASMAEELLQLREAKFGVDASLLETTHRAASLEGTLSSLEVECESLRQKCATAAMERAQSTADCAELRARLASAEEKVAALHQLMQA